MDLYSAARRLSRPMRFPKDTVGTEIPIEQRGAIGDGATCALVRADGVIDWACMPRFDSPSVFGALLDPQRGGLTAITPRAPFESLQRYDPDTNVLETLFTIPGQGVVRVVDFMPWADDARAAIHEIHRRVTCMEGAAELSVIFDPRFDYGRAETRFEIQTHGVLARSGTDTMVALVSGAPEWHARRDACGLETTMTLRAGESAWMVLSWDAVRAEPIRAYRTMEHLRATRQRWRDWSGRIGYYGPWRHHVVRSALLLKLLTYRPSGAVVAAPTTSLPEWLGGTRNWDYRYVWTRDAAMAVRATTVLGYDREATEFFYFIRDALLRTHDLGVMYTIEGEAVPEEQTLTHLRGYAGSLPVRIGNGARHQLQLDAAGSLIDAAYVYERFDHVLTLRTWRELRRIIEGVAVGWDQPDDGIWEPRSGRQHNVHSKLMCWVALHRGAWIARTIGDTECEASWTRRAEEVRAAVLAHGLDARGQHFVRSYGSSDVDAALLLLPIHGLLDPSDPRVLRTIERVQAELGAGPFLYRYRVDDGVGGPEGAFVLCGFWLAEALAIVGRIEEAQDVFAAHVEGASSHLGLLAEEVDPSTGAGLGNFPQVFSHLGLINAAARIDLALRMRDGGFKDAPRFTPPKTVTRGDQ